MNILQILPELNVGGVETGTVDLARHLVKLGHKAVVVSNGGALVDDLKKAGVIHYKLPVQKKSLLNLFKMIKPLVKIIQDEKIDIVHARSRMPAWIAYCACRKTGTVFITTCHGYYGEHFFSRVMAWGKKVIVPSNVIATHMINKFSVRRENIRLVNRCVDLEKFTYSRRKNDPGAPFNVGIVARITPLKGHIYFIKAMAIAARSIGDFRIWIVGDAPPSKREYRLELEALTRQLGLWEHTEFLGTQRDIPAILKNLDLVVMATTTNEAFGRSIIEAQACGVPVVATAVGGTIDIIEHEQTGLLVPPGDAAAMAQAIVRIHDDPGFADFLKEKARKKIEACYDVQIMVQKTLDVYRESLQGLRILVLKISSLGDIILSTPSLRALREKFGKSCKITLVVGEEFKELVLRCPYIDELLVCRKNQKGIGWILELAGKLRKRCFDISIDFQNNRASHLISFLSMAMHRYGYDNKKMGFLLNHGLKDDGKPLDPVSHQFRVLNALGITPQDQRLELWPSQEDADYIDELLGTAWLGSGQKLVGINIAASPRWQSKSWPAENIKSLCEELAKKAIRVVLTGSESDIGTAEQLVSQLKDTKPLNACGKTSINQLACLVGKCHVYVSPDSAPLHIASAMNRPFVGLFGPTDSRRHLPPGKARIVISKEMSCSPCYKSKCAKKACMYAISVQDVLEAVQSLLQPQPAVEQESPA